MDCMELQIGDTFDGPSKTLTDAHFLFFSGISGDVHPIHYDVEYAKGSHFGKPLAHGLLLVSMAALGATTARDRIDGFIFVEEGSRFLMPVLVGDTIQPRFVLEKIWSEAHRRFYRFQTSLTNQRGEKVLEGFHVYRVLPHKSVAGEE